MAVARFDPKRGILMTPMEAQLFLDISRIEGQIKEYKFSTMLGAAKWDKIHDTDNNNNRR